MTTNIDHPSADGATPRRRRRVTSKLLRFHLMNQRPSPPRLADVACSVHENAFLAGGLGVIEGFVGGLTCRVSLDTPTSVSAGQALSERSRKQIQGGVG
jgi:hypothetical protein